MAKNKKKRNKSYTGKDAAVVKPVITKIKAVNRSKVGQWWFEKKKIIKPIAKFTSITVFIILIILEIIKLAS